MKVLTDFNSEYERLIEERDSIKQEFSKIEKEYYPKIRLAEEAAEKFKQTFQRKNPLKNFNKAELIEFFVELLNSKPDWIVEEYSDYKVGKSHDGMRIILKFEKYFFDGDYCEWGKYDKNIIKEADAECLGLALGTYYLGRSTAITSNPPNLHRKYNTIELKFNF